MAANNKIKIFGDVFSKNDFALKTAKQVELLDEHLNRVQSKWITGNSFDYLDVDPALYVVKLSFSTGEQYSKVVDVRDGGDKSVDFDLEDLLEKDKAFSGPQEIDFMLFEESDLEMDAPLGDSGGIDLGENKYGNIFKHEIERSVRFELKRLFLYAGNLLPETIITFSDSELKDGPLNQDFFSGKTTMLLLESSDYEPILLCCPFNQQMSVQVKLNPTGDGSNPVVISLMSENSIAESLLNLMSNGSMIQAESFFDGAAAAEMLLLEKRRDVPAAAIGGYFLLKIRDYARMHNWANNLANWFKWMPDGCIIHAWQMINDGVNEPGDEERVRERLLEAQQRGIPLYTEGVRLLFDGLKQLDTIARGGDREVADALKMVHTYVGKIDWSQKNTTVINPGRKINGEEIPLTDRNDLGLFGFSI
jgi:hypothetical protein